MSDYFAPAIHPVARKEHRCIYCYGPIVVGEKHAQQTGFYEGKPFRNRFHNECFDDCVEEARFGGFEFMPGCADYPERVKAIVDERRVVREVIK